MRHLLVLAMSILALAAAAHAAELAIVIAIDVSTSVTADSYILQRDGIARAFKDPRLIDAVSAAPGGIEALVLEWSDPESIAVAIPWTHITDKRSATAFAASVHAAARNSGGLTAIGSGTRRGSRSIRAPAATGGAASDRHLRRRDRQSRCTAAGGP